MLYCKRFGELVIRSLLSDRDKYINTSQEEGLLRARIICPHWCLKKQKSREKGTWAITSVAHFRKKEANNVSLKKKRKIQLKDNNTSVHGTERNRKESNFAETSFQMWVLLVPTKTEAVTFNLKALVSLNLKWPHVYAQPFRMLNQYN